MTRQLRKRHLQVWSALLFLLPAIILTGWLAVKKPVITDTLLQPGLSVALPVIMQTVKKDKYTVSLRTNNQRSQTQLEWINSAQVTTPSALIYKIYPENNGDISKNQIIGRIESKGIYHFALKNDSTENKRFVLYDIIHSQIIESINF
jgi:hypothetical protein